MYIDGFWVQEGEYYWARWSDDEWAKWKFENWVGAEMSNSPFVVLVADAGRNGYVTLCGVEVEQFFSKITLLERIEFPCP